MEQSPKARRNPFRSEQDAFRVVVYIVAAALIIVLATTLISTWLGVVLAIVASAAGLIQTVIWLSEMLREPSDAESSSAESGEEEG